MSAHAVTGEQPGGVIAVAGEARADLVPAETDGVLRVTPGGNSVNVAVGLARLEVPVRMLARIADDLLGRRLRAHLQGNGVDLSRVVTAAEPTSLAIVDPRPDGDTVHDFRVAGAADWQWSDFELAGAVDREVVAVHAGSVAMVTPPGARPLRRLLARARGGATISYDPGCRPELVDAPEAVLARVHEVLAVSDIVKVSAKDLAWLSPGRTPAEVLADWLHRGPVLAVVTLGARGMLVGTSAGGAPVSRPAVPVTVVDTTGAGDAFSAGLLAGLHRRGLLGGGRRRALATLPALALADLLDEAALVAAVTCTRRGADSPTAAELATVELAQPV
ncbi:carbohydrate kinase family protein [Pseudonocardia sp. H11422]|uniref:carbohydrate kinase family protein n=1 Tax=Pseudonocardia sp. H11422 TaxID=2835866 RepID=UPI001BDD2476|nr:carbohydrate kinase [Pseudonocardia sp. H11422]